MRSKLVTFLLSFFFGIYGSHRFYVGKVATGVLYVLTGGLWGIGALVDSIRIAANRFEDKDGDYLCDDIHPAICWVLVVIQILFVVFFVLGVISILYQFAVFLEAISALI